MPNDTTAMPSPEYSEALALEERARRLTAEVFSDPEAISAIKAGIAAEAEGRMVQPEELKRKYVG